MKQEHNRGKVTGSSLLLFKIEDPKSERCLLPREEMGRVCYTETMGDGRASWGAGQRKANFWAFECSFPQPVPSTPQLGQPGITAETEWRCRTTRPVVLPTCVPLLNDPNTCATYASHTATHRISPQWNLQETKKRPAGGEAKEDSFFPDVLNQSLHEHL